MIDCNDELTPRSQQAESRSCWVHSLVSLVDLYGCSWRKRQQSGVEIKFCSSRVSMNQLCYRRAHGFLNEPCGDGEKTLLLGLEDRHDIPQVVRRCPREFEPSLRSAITPLNLVDRSSSCRYFLSDLCLRPWLALLFRKRSGSRSESRIYNHSQVLGLNQRDPRAHLRHSPTKHRAMSTCLHTQAVSTLVTVGVEEGVRDASSGPC